MNRKVFKEKICSYCIYDCSNRTMKQRMKYRVKYINKIKTKVLKCKSYIKSD